MRRPFFRISSVIRWLLVVAGCVVLETAQPAFAAEAVPAVETVETADTPPVPDLDEGAGNLIFPRGHERVTDHSPTSTGGGFGWTTWIFAVALVGAGGWLLWRKKQEALRPGRGRKIQIEETRPMGNRQYLVVASCEGKRFLLGVTPGRIDVVTSLDNSAGPPV